MAQGVCGETLADKQECAHTPIAGVNLNQCKQPVRAIAPYVPAIASLISGVKHISEAQVRAQSASLRQERQQVYARSASLQHELQEVDASKASLFASPAVVPHERSVAMSACHVDSVVLEWIADSGAGKDLASSRRASVCLGARKGSFLRSVCRSRSDYGSCIPDRCEDGAPVCAEECNVSPAYAIAAVARSRP